VTPVLDKKAFNSLYDDIIDLVGSSALEDALRLALSGDLERSKPFLFRGYVDISNYAKANYMRIKTGLLDRHKCSAAFMVSTLNGLRLDKCAKLTKNERLREDIAIYVGLTALRTFIHGDNENYKNAGLIAFLDKNDGFMFPGTICDNQPYADNLATELYYNRKENKLSVLSLSHELFWVEKYNRMLSEM
jgi:hypothetical protein